MSTTVETTETIEAPGRAHSVLVYVLILLGAVILLVTTVGVWVDRQVLDTDNWVEVSDELLADPEVRAAVSTFVVD